MINERSREVKCFIEMPKKRGFFYQVLMRGMKKGCSKISEQPIRNLMQLEIHPYGTKGRMTRNES